MKRQLLPIFCVFVLTAFHMPAFADQKKCKARYKAELFDQALTACREAAIQGDSASKFYLGMMYLNGQGIAKNDQIATRLIQESAQLVF